MRGAMVYAIIDALSDIEELITVAYAEKPCDLAVWFLEEVNDTADMYLSDDKDFEKLDKITNSMDILTHEDACELSDIDGLTVDIADISISVIGAFYNYEEMKKALEEFVSDKPKFKKIQVPDNPYESNSVVDSLNRALVKAAI